MKVLVIDRELLATQLIRNRLEGQGHMVVEEAVKNTAIEYVKKEDFDVVFVDPAPLNNARSLILNIRRAARNYPYIVLTTQDMDMEEATRSGANDMLPKPLDAERLLDMLDSAQILTSLVTRIGDESEDFPSAGGVIAKSAFNQLFLSAIDRADRYAERAFLVFIGISNYQSLVESDGPYAAEYSVAKLSQHLVRLRRQSDVIAQTGKSEFCLMLQRPQYKEEPMEAANRFADALSKIEDLCSSDGSSSVNVYVSLIELPVGKKHIDHNLEFKPQGRAAG